MKKIALVLAMLGLTTSAFALESGISETGLSYNEVGIGYSVEGDPDSDIKGMGIGITALLTKNIYVFGNAKNPSSAVWDTQQYIAGVGVRTAITSNADLYASISSVSSKFSSTTVSVITSGTSFATGVRAIIAPKVEASLGLSYFDGSNRFLSVTETRYGVGLGYQLTDKVIGRTTYYMNDDSQKGYSVSLGYMF